MTPQVIEVFGNTFRPGFKSMASNYMGYVIHTLQRMLRRALPCGLWLACALFMTQGALAKETLSGIGIDAGNNWARSWVDLNGDGRSDYCYRYNADGEKIRCFYSKDGLYTNTPDIDETILRNHQAYQWWFDVDGDGLADLCRGYDYKRPDFRVECRFTKDKFQRFADVILPFSGYCVDSECSELSREGLYRPSDIFFADVNGDQRIDVCFIYSGNSGQAPLDLRCRLSNGASFDPVTSAWTSVAINPGADHYPRAFADVNGDGFPDFCRTLGDGTLRCLLGSDAGFTTTEIVSPVLDRGHKEGATFIDFNADGKSDYCRITGAEWQYRLRCTASTGLGWDTANERVSPIIPNEKVGHAYARWWIDINGDGLPDFCRATGENPDFGDVDIVGDLTCRLNKGDGSGSDAVGAFYYSDIELPVNFGRGDGGRQWCDPTGSGFPTLCRNSFTRVYGPKVCENNYQGREICNTPILSTTTGLITGLGIDNTPQSNHPLLTSYTDGLGAETRIGYLPLTSEDVYSRSGIANTERRFVGPSPSSPVVYETRAWMVGSAEPNNGLTLTGNARYFYRDLANDRWAGSSLGFSERWMFSEGSNTIDHTTFFQGLGNVNGSRLNDTREIGMVMQQSRYAIDSGVVPTPVNNGAPLQSERGLVINQISKTAVELLGAQAPTTSDETQVSKPSPPKPPNPFRLLQRTTNTLSDTSPPNPRYRYIGKSKVESYDLNGTTAVTLPTATTTTVQDNFGNVTNLTQTKVQQNVGKSAGTLTWTTTTVNEYPDTSTADGQKWARLGRLKKSTVTSTAPSLDEQMGANLSYPGRSQFASEVSSPLAPVGQEKPKPLPLPPQLLMPILQLLLED